MSAQSLLFTTVKEKITQLRGISTLKKPHNTFMRKFRMEMRKNSLKTVG